MEEVRLQKYLAECGIASRRKCEEFITDGLVKVNGKVDKKFAKKKVSISLYFETDNGLMGARSFTQPSTVNSDGTFKIDKLIRSNKNENVIIPCAIRIS